MQNLRFVLALGVLGCTAPSWVQAAAITHYFSNCANPSNNPGHTLTVDPSNHLSDAYPNIAAALQVAKPGDTIALMTGDYGVLSLSGMNQGDFITIAAAVRQTPKFTKINVGGLKPASRWHLTDLTVSAMSPPVNGKWAHDQLIMVSNSDNIIIDHNNISSTDGVMEWAPELSSSPVTNAPSHGIAARQSSCISIVDNRLRNLFHGIDFGGDQTAGRGQYFLISGNTIDNFAGDGIEHYGSHIRIENNRITNGHDICNNQCVHSDGIQGWNYNHLPVRNSDIVIDGNVIIAQTDPNLVLPIDTLQGITIFDGKWDGVRVFNNLIVVNAWHGITFNRVKNGSIINNTLAPTNPFRKTWIMVNGDSDDPPGTSYNVVVRNNIVPGVTKDGENPKVPGVMSEDNLGLETAKDFENTFVKFDPEHFDYDLYLSRGSAAIGKGLAEGAPTTDIEGHPRRAPIDLGAYAYQGR